jgi:large subunit ribosomal protein L19
MNLSAEILKETNKKEEKKNYIDLVESKFLKKSSEKNLYYQNIEIGDLLRIGYTLLENGKERIQYYEGVIIAKNNKGLGRSFTLRRSVQGIGVEQVFLFHSPKIFSITKKQASKVRRAKLYFLRNLIGKKTKLKIKLG